MPTEQLRPARLFWTRLGIAAVLLLTLLWGWSSARSALVATRSGKIHAAAPPEASSVRDPAPTDADLKRPPADKSERKSGRLVQTLRDQVANSPVLQDDEAQGSLLESLDQAGDLWERTHRQNRQALQQLQRQVRIGESRRAPHLVLITFEHAGDPDSPRDRLFADLSQRGVSFSEHYAGGLSPVSGWWSLMTGNPASRASAGEKRFELRESDVTIATTLWKAGYDTAFLGVWPGSAAPLRCGFEEWTGLETPLDDVPLYPARLATARNQMTVAANANGGQKVSLWTLLDAEIASYFRSHASSSRPWFLQIRLPEIETDSSNSSAEAVVEHALEALEKSGVSSQTCVFVTTLSGPRTSPVISEHRLRTPLVMVGGHPENAGRVARNVTVAWDLLPTLLDIAGASKRPRDRDGRSLVQNSSPRPWDNERIFYWQADEQNGAQLVRRGEWFGTVAPGARQLQLFHLPTDPDLKKDVASAHPAVVQRLLAPETTPAATASPR